jgi:primosomal protein N' (replication factor Y)
VGAAQPPRRLQARAEPLIVRVHVDVPALDRDFDYAVPDKLAAAMRVGTIVRVPLHGRRVRGWVTAVGVEPREGLHLVDVAKVTGYGPPAELVELAGWAAWRWAGRTTAFLRAASPDRAVVGLPPPIPPRPPRARIGAAWFDEAFELPRAVVRVPPGGDRFPVVEAALRLGPAFVLCASVSDATNLAQRLRRAGEPVALLPTDWARAAAGGSTVIGTRAAAWAPHPDAAAFLVLDAHDDAHVEERAPTWGAWPVAAERAHRAGVPCVAVTPVPTVELAEWAKVLVPSRNDERSGWPPLEIVDRRGDDPRSGLYSERLMHLLRSGGRVACILNRKGRATLLACGTCGEVVQCEVCGASMVGAEVGLRCRHCEHTRPSVCSACGGQRLKQLRVGVARAREELEALTGEPVGGLTAESDEVPDTRVVIGTEAALHRLPAVAGVAFLDFDQELLAPHFRATENALALLARAARLVGGRRRDGRLLVQTRLPGHEVLAAALHADPGPMTTIDRSRRQALGLPPFMAMALVSGEAAEGFVEQLGGVDVRGPVDGQWQVRAPDHTALCDALGEATRPPGRLRVEVDPRRA